jgi:squalene-hopene/tetraprenyl-beta-curcumene cyclase
MLYAGVTVDDPRVKAALAWLRKHYTEKENPGLGNSGLYYYHYMGKLLNALDEPLFEDASGG